MEKEITMESKSIKGNVLVVDDEEKNRELLRVLLEAEGFTVLEAEDGEKALKVVEDTPTDVIILDIMMPKMDGFEVCRRLKDDQKTAPIPILLVTALKERDDRIMGIEAGANDFLSKPIDKQDLTLRVRNAAYTKSLFDQLQENYEKLKELEKLRDNLTNMIVHDMRSPLMGANGYLKLLQMRAKDNLTEKQNQYVIKASNSVSTLMEIVNSLLDVSKLEEGKMKLDLQQCDLRNLAKDALEMLGSLKDKLNIYFEPSEEPILINCDPDLITRVIANLLGNAIKFTPESGKVEISIKKEDNQARFAVTDTGYGIPPEYQTKIFEKFGQVEISEKKQKYSTGLGLTFCKLTVEAHGGEIGVDSILEQGSTFWFVLPA
ncbi:MAG: response regulator [Candidatus Cloacimonetes bacterium]|nr:response regulator [Candidatus Cloacimonadota bacterium]